MIWIKLIHIAGIAVWGAGLICLPGLYVQRTHMKDPPALHRLHALVRFLYVALMSPAAQVLFTIAPFSMLEPLAVLSETAEYQKGFDWIYLLGAIAIAVLSHARQRRSFYYAGVINSGVALFLIAARNEWFNRASWATTLVIVGLAALTCASVMPFLVISWMRSRTIVIQLR